MQQQDDRFLTTTDAARALGISSETVRLWENTGRLPAIRTVSGQRLFSRAVVDRIAHERQHVVEQRSLRR